MQCHKTVGRLSRILVFLLLSFSVCSISTAEPHVPQNNQLENKFQSDPEGIKWDLTARASQAFASQSDDKLHEFKTYLDKKAIEEDFKYYRVDILFLQAETNYKLNDYKKAYEQYLQLQLIVDKKSTYGIGIEKRLLVLEESIKRSEYKSKLQNLFRRNAADINEGRDRNSTYIIVLLLFTMFSIILFYLFKSISNKYDSKNIEDEPRINAKLVDSLITLERMRRNDGRVSKQLLAEYKGLDKENLDAFVKGKDAHGYACLLARGHAMIEKLNRHAPYPVALLTPKGDGILSPIWRDTLFGVAFCLLWGLGLIVEQLPEFMKPGQELNYFTLLMIGTLIIMSITAVRTMAIRTIDSLDALISMLEPPKLTGEFEETTLEDLGKWVRFLFRSPWQFYVAIMILGIIVTKDIILPCALAENITFFCKISFWDLLFVSLLLLVLSPLVWSVIGSIIVTNKICGIQDLEFNPLSPLKTMGLKKWVSVIGSYNINASIVMTLGCLIPVVNGYIYNEGASDDDWFWFILIMPLLIFYWIYPYFKMRGLINSIKIRRMQFLKAKIANIFNMWEEKEEFLLEEEEDILSKNVNDEARLNKLFRSQKVAFKELQPQFDIMNNYYSMFQKIDESPESYIDFNSVLQLAKAIGIPSFFAILSALFLNP